MERRILSEEEFNQMPEVCREYIKSLEDELKEKEREIQSLREGIEYHKAMLLSVLETMQRHAYRNDLDGEQY